MAKLLGVRGSNPARLFGDGGLKVIDPRRTAAGNDAEAAVGRLTDPSPEVASIISQYVFNESLAGRWQHVTRIWMTQTNAASAYTCLKSGSTATPAAAYTWSTSGVRLTTDGEVDLNYDSSQDYAGATQMCYGVTSSNFQNSGSNTYFAASAAGIGAFNLNYNYDSYDLASSIGGAPAVISTLPDIQPFGVIRTDIASSTGYTRVRREDGSGQSTYAPLSLSMPDVCLIENVQTWQLFYMASHEMEWEGFRDNTQSAMAALGAL